MAPELQWTAITIAMQGISNIKDTFKQAHHTDVRCCCRQQQSAINQLSDDQRTILPIIKSIMSMLVLDHQPEAAIYAILQCITWQQFTTFLCFFSLLRSKAPSRLHARTVSKQQQCCNTNDRSPCKAGFIVSQMVNQIKYYD
jgi:hypothetical protein